MKGERIFNNILFGGNIMKEKKLLTKKYDDFIKKDFVLEDLL